MKKKYLKIKGNRKNGKGRKMLLKNRKTRTELVYSFSKFEEVFRDEIQNALESYKKTFQNKPYFKNEDLDFNFYTDLRYNFNNFSNSVWYIERIY